MSNLNINDAVYSDLLGIQRVVAIHPNGKAIVQPTCSYYTVEPNVVGRFIPIKGWFGRRTWKFIPKENIDVQR